MTAFSSTHLALAEHWLQVGRYDNALHELDRAGDDATSRTGLALRGRAYLHLSRPQEAADCARRGLAQSPDDIGLLGLLAGALGSLDDLAGAERALLGALRLAPDAAGLLVYYATLLTQAGQYDKAGRVLDRAARVAPDSPAVFAERADLALARGRTREARRWSQEALARDPEHADARVTAGAVALRTGEVVKARRHLRSAAADDLTNPHLRTAAYEASYRAHPLMLPVRPIMRFGVFATMAFGMCLVLLSGVLGGAYGTVAAGAWVAFVVYTWVVPRLLRMWLRRRGRL